MKEPGEMSMQSLSEVFKALSDETRLQIIALLSDGEELCVCDLVGGLGQTQSKISRHLRYLYHAGLVEDRRDGLWMHYRISSRLSPGQRAILDTLVDVMAEAERNELRQRLQDWLVRKQEDSLSCGDVRTLADVRTGEDVRTGT
jgi:ArsR family transcriptional regulator